MAGLDRTSDSDGHKQESGAALLGHGYFIQLTRFPSSFGCDFDRELALRHPLRVGFSFERCCCRDRTEMEGENIFLFVPNLIGKHENNNCTRIFTTHLARMRLFLLSEWWLGIKAHYWLPKFDRAGWILARFLIKKCDLRRVFWNALSILWLRCPRIPLSPLRRGFIIINLFILEAILCWLMNWFVGYARVILALISFYFMPTNYVLASWCYVTSALLDAFDGHAARIYDQSNSRQLIRLLAYLPHCLKSRTSNFYCWYSRT